MGQGGEPKERHVVPANGRPAPARQGFTGQVRKDGADAALFPACTILDRQQHVIVEAQSGAHALDVTASKEGEAGEAEAGRPEPRARRGSGGADLMCPGSDGGQM